MIKIMRLVLSLLVIFLFVACGGDSGGKAPDSGQTNVSGVNNTRTDKTPPVIKIIGKNPTTVVQDNTYKDAGATAKDDVDGVIKVKKSGSVKTSVVGTYIITYRATDKAGNKSTAKRTVKVVKKTVSTDKTPPVITILGKNPVTINQYSSYIDAGATAKDNKDGTVTVKSSGSVNSSNVGTYTISYSATDKAGNKATAKRTVKVVKKVVVADITPPVITILGDNPASVVQNDTYTDAGATAKDTIDGTVTVKVTGSVDTSTLGTYSITYTATDKAGNKITATRKVKVTLPPDTTAPVITISGDNPFEISQGETFSDPGATATDDRDGIISVTPSGSVDMSIAGDYTITYTATDNAGNEANATRTVTVKPADVVWNVSDVTGLRQALEDAAANGENDRIVLEAGVYNVDSDGLGTFKFNDNEAFNLTIESAEGLTNKDVVLDGNNTHQVFNFNNTEDSILILKGVSVIDGNSSTSGGGVYSNHNIKVEDCNISNNSSSYYGGGLYSNGLITVTNSTILNNSSTDGGGFYSGSTTTVTNSTISDNNSKDDCGGFWSNGTTTVTNSTISNNIARGDSGGFYSRQEITMTNSTISNNSSNDGGGGFWSNRVTIVKNSTISRNSTNGSGGGFYSNGATVTNSTIFNNSSSGHGGGFYTYDSTTITGSTVSNNSSESSGGGFYSKEATVTNSLFSENNATTGAIYASSSHYSSYYSYISNNVFIGNKGSIYSEGVFINNIFDNNDADITLNGDSKIYNNYIDYNKIEDNGYNVIKKSNLQFASVGDVYLNSDNKTLASNSPVIDKGLNPSSATFKKIIGGEEEVYNYETGSYETVYPQYNKMIELLKTDMVGNQRVHNGTVDMGAVEYGSSK